MCSCLLYFDSSAWKFSCLHATNWKDLPSFAALRCTAITLLSLLHDWGNDTLFRRWQKIRNVVSPLSYQQLVSTAWSLTFSPSFKHGGICKPHKNESFNSVFIQPLQVDSVMKNSANEKKTHQTRLCLDLLSQPGSLISDSECRPFLYR